MRSLHRGQRRVELRQIDARLIRALRHAEAAADVDDVAHRGSAASARPAACADRCQLSTSNTPLPVCACRPTIARSRCLAQAFAARRASTAARRTSNARRPSARDGDDRGPCRYRCARTRSRPLNSSGQFSSTMQVVDGDLHALLERPLVLVARREVRREQDALAIDARHDFKHVLDLAARHALEADALAANSCAGSPDADWPSSHRARVDARRAPRSDCARVSHRREVVDVSARRARGRARAARCASLPPRPRSDRGLVRAGRTAAPTSGRARDRPASGGSASRAAARPAGRPGSRRPRSEVQIVRRLADQ